MPPVFRIAALGLCLGAALLSAAEPPTVRIDGTACVSLAAAASALGMREKSGLLFSSYSLSDGADRMDFRPESSETQVDGLRVYLGDKTVFGSGQLYVSAIDFDRCLVPMLRPELIPGPAPRPVRTIAIDPGHGASDHGTENRRLGMMEKTFTLDTALRLGRLLEARGYHVVMTRRIDPAERIPLQVRALIANQAHADLFVSIHFNSLAPDTHSRGIELFTFPPRLQCSTGEKTGMESEAAPVNRFDDWSVVFAQAVHRRVRAAMGTEDRGKKLKHLGVLRDLDCPGILIEGGFLSNDAEAHRIATAAYRDQLAAAIAAGIDDYSRTLQSLRLAPTKPLK